MGKRGKGKRVAPERFKNVNNSGSNKKTTKDEFVLERDMYDEIDAFHKERDFVPMDVSGDAGDSDDDDDVVPVFDHKDLDGDDEEDDDDEEEYYDPGLAKKIAQQQRFLKQRIGGVDDEMGDDEDDEDTRLGWGRKKNIYYDADNVDNESDDEERENEEEKAVEELLYQNKKDLKLEDVGLSESDEDDSDMEPTLEERAKSKDAKTKSDADDVLINVIPRDLSDLPLDEQMDAIHSSAPELVRLLSELNDAHSQLDNEINPLIKEVKKNGGGTNDGMHYLEVKQLLLLSYCQAITFYLLLKSEGLSTNDHPVLDRIAQIKDLLDKTKELDKNLPSDYKDIIKRRCEAVTVSEFTTAEVASPVDSSPVRELEETEESAVVDKKTILNKTEVEKENRTKGRHEKHQKEEARIGHQSKEMLKLRASLEDKLRQKGILGSAKSNSKKTQKQCRQKVNGLFETFDDYNDDPTDNFGHTGLSNVTTKLLPTKRLSELVTSARANKPKVTSGEDDLVDRGDIGERRRMHELRVLKKAGIESEDSPPVNEPSSNDDAMEDGDESDESEDEFYQQVKKQKLEKLASKQKTPSSSKIFVPEEDVDGKRHISYQMEKNRGLTRSRKKLTKNPRKKYKLKHKKAVVARKGQVRDIRKHTGPYGGETSGINARISRSIRLKG